ncbi:MAG: hypothetical protein JXA00_05720 [Candidatus Thermoplasmatota archaeon]|nr:hypothetical protein [Candidatus Thermoplasmatota archaeon]
MQNTVVQYILDNILLFLPLGITGIIVTLILFFTGKKQEEPLPENLSTDYTTMLKRKVNLYFVLYLFIWITIIIIGALSQFVPTILGAILASIPLIVMLLLKYKTTRAKVS